MSSSKYCGGCGDESIREECEGCFGRRGIIKVHWECWSECNLHCEFCYRTRAPVLSSADGKRLVSAVKTSGAATIVFAGGDPSIRPDICCLFDFAKQLGLKVEIQTNAQHTPEEFLRKLKECDLVGLSLDGPNADIHDRFRNKSGNFDRVLQLLEFLRRWSIPTILRTVVARTNYRYVSDIAPLLEPMENIARWSLLEFTPVGEGYLNRDRYQLSRSLFDDVATQIQARFRGKAQVDVYRSEAKVGTYALITPGGSVYGTGEPLVNGFFPTSGSILQDHLSVIAKALPFSPERHWQRYG